MTFKRALNRLRPSSREGKQSKADSSISSLDNSSSKLAVLITVRTETVSTPLASPTSITVNKSQGQMASHLQSRPTTAEGQDGFRTAGRSDPTTALSLLVLLPASAHMQQHPTPLPPSRPFALTSRKSGSTIPSLGNMPEVKGEGEDDMEKVLVAGRRLSLAPGIGAGTQTRSMGTFTPLSPLDPSPTGTPTAEVPAPVPVDRSPARPVFGAKRSSGRVTGPPSRRRPNTAATPAQAQISGVGPGVSRASMAVPGGGGGGGVLGRSRPGWEGDEVVGVLRASGLEGGFGSLPGGLRCLRSQRGIDGVLCLFQDDHSFGS